MSPGDIILWRDQKFGRHRFWEIKGVFIGALGQESVIELKSLTENPAQSYSGASHPTTFVPEPLLRGDNIVVYTPDIRGRESR